MGSLMWGGRAAVVSSFRLWMLQDCLYWHASATWHGHQGQCFWISRQVWWPPSVRTRTRGCVPEAHSSSSPEKSIRGSWRRGGNVVFDLDVAQQTRTTPSGGSWILVLSCIHSQRGDGLYQTRQFWSQPSWTTSMCEQAIKMQIGVYTTTCFDIKYPGEKRLKQQHRRVCMYSLTCIDFFFFVIYFSSTVWRGTLGGLERLQDFSMWLCEWIVWTNRPLH